ncbi:PAS domain S-box protein [Bradyrhizobium sp. USDA 4473]
MMRIPTMKSWSAEQWLLGGMVLALAATCVGLLLAPQPTASAHLIALALLVASLAAALLVMRLAARTHRRMEAMLRGQASGEQRAMEALRNSEAQWKEVFEHNPVMYFMVDATGLVLSVNTFGAAQLGYTVDELLGQSVLRVFAAEDRDIVLRNVAACLDKIGQPHSWEIRKVRKDASRLWGA